MYASFFNSEPFDKSKIPSFFDLLTSSEYFEDVDFTTDRWKLLERNFETWRLAKTTEIVIPKHIHQIWVGSKIPRDYSAMCKVWQEKHPDWEYTLWGDEAYDLLDAKMREDILKTKNYGIISDVLRYQILHNYGGVYLDCDFICVRNLEPLITNADFITSLAYSHPSEAVIICFLGSIPAHPILKRLLDTIKMPTKTDGLAVLNITGPKKSTEAFYDVSLESTWNKLRHIAFPIQFLLPVPLSKKRLSRANYIDKIPEYLSYESFAVHLWDMTWLKKKFIVIRLWKYFRRTVSLRKLVLAPKTMCVRLCKRLFR